MNFAETARLETALRLWRYTLDSRYEIGGAEYDALKASHERLLSASDTKATRLTAPTYEHGWTPEDPYGPIPRDRVS